MPKLHHDYNLPGLYWLTLTTAGRYPHLGFLAKDSEPYVEKSRLACEVCNYLYRVLPERYPNLIISHLSISPSRIDLIIDVHKPFATDGNLGKVMTNVRKWCNKIFWSAYASHGTQLFEKGYFDQPLDDDLLDHWRKYLDGEPKRLTFISSNPEFYTCVHEILTNDTQYLSLGNPFLLNIPLKERVIASDTESQRQFQPKWDRWMECGERGGVLVSAANSARERAVLSQAMQRKYKLVWIRETGNRPCFPLFSQAYYACELGHLLMLSPIGFSGVRNWLTPEQRDYLNKLSANLSQPMLEYRLHPGLESGFIYIPPTRVIHGDEID